MTRKRSRVTVTSPSSRRVVALEDMKDHLRVASDAELGLLDSQIQAAQEWWERRTSRSLITQTFQMVRDHWPDEVPGEDHDEMELPRAPLVGSTTVSITYVTEAGSTRTFASTAYLVDDGGDFDFPRVVLKDGEDWPTEDLQEASGIRVSWDAGYGDGRSSVPVGIQHGVKLTVGHWFENREAVTTEGRPREVPMAVESLIDSFAIPDVP